MLLTNQRPQSYQPRVITSQPSPVGRANGSKHQNYFSERRHNLPYRSRSLDTEQRYIDDDFNYDDDDDWRHIKNVVQNTTKRVYNYQPYISSQATGVRPRVYLNEFYYRQNKPSPRFVDESEWYALDRSIQNYRDEMKVKPKYFSPNRTSGSSPKSDAFFKRPLRVTSFLDRGRTVMRPLTPVIRLSDKRKDNLIRRHSVDYIPSSMEYRRINQGEIVADGRNSYYPRCYDARVHTGNMDNIYYQQENASRSPRTIDAFKNERSIFNRQYGEQRFYKIHCCCFSFRWPPCVFEEVAPPQPMYKHN